MNRPPRDALRPLLRLIHELTRRHVVRVVIAYLVAAWLIVQVASTLLPTMGFDNSAIRVVLVVVAVGLPVSIVVSWYFDLTLQGFRLTGPDEDTGIPTPLTGTVALAGSPPDPLSLAVVAFSDHSEAHDQEFLAKGISEELTNLLGRVASLKIVPRSSAFAFEGKGLDIRQVGRHLNVAHVLDGSVRKAGRRLRIAVELIDVVGGYSKWMNVYDRDAEAVFDIQNEIARNILEELGPHLLENAAPSVLSHPGTKSVEAYDAYLKGRFYWNSRYAVGLEKSLECFGRAAQIDPNYALPLSGLADAYNLLAFYNFVPPRDGYGKADELARRAHALAPSRAETNASLAFVQHFFDWNFAAAETSYRRALAAQGNYGPARFWFAFLDASLGRQEDARLQIEAAKNAEPFSAIIHGGASYLDYFQGRHESGLRAATEVLDADPNFGPAHMFLGFHRLAIGDYTGAVECWRTAVARQDRMLLAHLMLATSLALSGDNAEARRILLHVDNAAKGYVSSHFRAIASLSLGERDTALGWLEKALEERNSFLVLAGMEPLLASLRGEPRFQRVLQQVGVPIQAVNPIQRAA